MTKAHNHQPPKEEDKPPGKAIWKSRAVTRYYVPGEHIVCALCDKKITFSSRSKINIVICNVYKKGKWQRVEHYHAECYQAAGKPYGEAPFTLPGLTRSLDRERRAAKLQ